MGRIVLFFIQIVIILLTSVSNAQIISSFNVGWNETRFFKPLSNLEIPIYQFNQVNPDIEKKYNMPEFFNGPYLDFKLGNTTGGVLLAWSNKHGITRAKGIASGSGDTEYKIRHIKTSLNMFSLGGYFNLFQRLALGTTFDMGAFRITKKIAVKEQFDKAKWEAFYDQKSTVAFGLTANLSYSVALGEYIHIRFQPYAQYVIIRPFQISTGIYTNKYFYNPANFGLTTFMSFIWEE